MNIFLQNTTSTTIVLIIAGYELCSSKKECHNQITGHPPICKNALEWASSITGAMPRRGSIRLMNNDDDMVDLMKSSKTHPPNTF